MFLAIFAERELDPLQKLHRPALKWGRCSRIGPLGELYRKTMKASAIGLLVGERSNSGPETLNIDNLPVLSTYKFPVKPVALNPLELTMGDTFIMWDTLS